MPSCQEADLPVLGKFDSSFKLARVVWLDLNLEKYHLWSPLTGSPQFDNISIHHSLLRYRNGRKY